MKDLLHAIGIMAGCMVVVLSVTLFADRWKKEQMSRELEMWNRELLDQRRQEFMDQMERKHS